MDGDRITLRCESLDDPAPDTLGPTRHQSGFVHVSNPQSNIVTAIEAQTRK